MENYGQGHLDQMDSNEYSQFQTHLSSYEAYSYQFFQLLQSFLPAAGSATGEYFLIPLPDVI